MEFVGSSAVGWPVDVAVVVAVAAGNFGSFVVGLPDLKVSPLEEVKLQPVKAKLSLAAVAAIAAAAAFVAVAFVAAVTVSVVVAAAAAAVVVAVVAADSCKDSYQPLALADPLDPFLVAALD